MLKYFDVIKKLSDVDKIRILCDINALSDKNFRALGIPEVRIGDVWTLCGDVYPSPKALSNTWDVSLVSSVADDIFRLAGSREMGFVKIPEPRVRINPYRISISEDPFLGAEISKEYLAAAERAGIAAGVGGFGVYNDEAEWLDEKPDERFIYEYIVKPYIETTSKTGCAAIFTEPDTSAENYKALNSSLMRMVSEGKVAQNATPLCAHVTAEKTVSYINRGGLFFEGSALALESALSRYKQLTKMIEHGTSTVEELQSEVLKGRAISEEMIDDALDRLLDFVFAVKRKPNLSLVDTNESLAIKATESSVVLLKNQNGRLPLKRSEKIALIGDVAMPSGGEGCCLADELSTLLSESGYQVSGLERGYDLSVDRSEELVEGAVSLAKSADAVLLFLGFTDKRASKLHKERKLSIPANQKRLLEALETENKKIIAILPSDTPLDVGYPENCSAMVMAPIKTKFCAKALQNILSGKVSPSGKLANSLYFDTEQRYLDYKTRRVRDKLCVGPFIGYRYYDYEEEFDGFPFGHGLSYTRFSYSSMTVSKDAVSFTVKNDGAMEGVETVQMYVGYEDLGAIRPLKELCGFARVELRPGETKTVQIPLRIPEIYSPKKGGFVTESGKYTVYIGSSLKDIRLKKIISAGSEPPEYDGKKISDYIYSESNINSDNFKLEAKLKPMKKSIFNIVAGAAAMSLAIILKIYCALNSLDSAFFDIFCIVLGISSIVFFVTEAIRRSKIRKAEKAALNEKNSKMFEDSEKISAYNAEKMFVDEFDVADEAVAADTEERIEGVDSEYLRYIDREVDFASAAAEFEKFAAERGFKVSGDVVKNIFAALSASRLVIVKGMNDNDFKTLLLMLSNYFESPLFIDSVNDNYNSCESVLFKTDGQGNKVKTNINYALESARNNGHSIHLAALTQVVGANMPLYFSSYVNYVKNPLANNHVTVFNERNIETSYYIPKNVWFVINLAEGASVAELPDFVSEIATVNLFDIAECAASEQLSTVHKFSYYQLDWLVERTASRFAVDEELWKKIDRFEEKINHQTPFHIGNKLWLCLEKFAYVYLACGGEQINAVDEAVAAKLMVPVMLAQKGATAEDGKSLDETVEAIFGEDRAEACKRVIKACGSNRA